MYLNIVMIHLFSLRDACMSQNIVFHKGGVALLEKIYDTEVE